MGHIFLTAASQKITSSDRSQQSRFTHHSGRPLLLWQFVGLRNWAHQLGRTQLRLAKSGPRVPVGVSLYSVPHHCTGNSTGTINECIQGAHLHHPWGYVCSEEQNWVKSAAKENLLQVVQTPNHSPWTGNKGKTCWYYTIELNSTNHILLNHWGIYLLLEPNIIL